MGRDVGADLAGGCNLDDFLGKGVPQISQLESRGLLRNVHAMHEISLGTLSVSGLAGEGELEPERLSLARLSDDDGTDVDTECIVEVGLDLDGISIGAFMDALGTPQRAQTMDPVDVNPMGFRLLQTSHSQNSTLLGFDRDGP